MTDRRNRDLVLSRLRELPDADEALQHQVARSSVGQAPGRGEPPIPIRASVVDLMADIEASRVYRAFADAFRVIGSYERGAS